MERMLYWMSVRSERYSECLYGLNDTLIVRLDWMLSWMSVRSEWNTERQYGL